VAHEKRNWGETHQRAEQGINHFNDVNEKKGDFGKGGTIRIRPPKKTHMGGQSNVATTPAEDQPSRRAQLEESTRSKKNGEKGDLHSQGFPVMACAVCNLERGERGAEDQEQKIKPPV